MRTLRRDAHPERLSAPRRCGARLRAAAATRPANTRVDNTPQRQHRSTLPLANACPLCRNGAPLASSTFHRASSPRAQREVSSVLRRPQRSCSYACAWRASCAAARRGLNHMRQRAHRGICSFIRSSNSTTCPARAPPRLQSFEGSGHAAPQASRVPLRKARVRLRTQQRERRSCACGRARRRSLRFRRQSAPCRCLRSRAAAATGALAPRARVRHGTAAAAGGTDGRAPLHPCADSRLAPQLFTRRKHGRDVFERARGGAVRRTPRPRRR